MQKRLTVHAVAVLAGGSSTEKATEIRDAFERYCRSTHARHRGQAWREFSDGSNSSAGRRHTGNAAR